MISMALPVSSIWCDSVAVTRVDEDAVKQLARSMASNGLFNPISVRLDKNRWRLVDGLHRLEAAKRLNWPSIYAIDVGTEAQAAKQQIISSKCFVKTHPAEYGRHIKQIMETQNLTMSEVAMKLGLSYKTVQSFIAAADAKKPNPGDVIMMKGAQMGYSAITAKCSRCAKQISLGETTCGECYVEKRTPDLASSMMAKYMSKEIDGQTLKKVAMAQLDIKNCTFKIDEKIKEDTQVKTHPSERGKTRCLQDGCKKWVSNGFCKKHSVSEISKFPATDRDGDPIWVAKDFKVTKIRDLDDDHLTNIVMFIQRKSQMRAKATGGQVSDILKRQPRYDALLAEMKRRDACPMCVDGVEFKGPEQTFYCDCSRGEQRAASTRVAAEMEAQDKAEKRKRNVQIAAILVCALASAGAYWTNCIPLLIEQLR